MRPIRALLPRIVGPFERYCSGCGMEPMAAYVTTPLIGLGVAPLRDLPGNSHLLERIVAFDRAEGEWANVTQTNMVTVSSFNGLQGLLWGYDLLPQPLVPHSLIKDPAVFDAAPLFAATRSLYGTLCEKRFPIAPGQHLLCASKAFYQSGPCRLYGTLAIGIPEDRSRNADLFMEDHGALEETEDEALRQEQEEQAITRLVDAVRQIGENLGIRYMATFASFRARSVQDDEIGCVLTAAPYIYLARKAVPENDPDLLTRMTLPQWEAAVRPDFLDR